MAKKSTFRSAFDDLTDYRRLVADASPALEFVRQHEEMIRRLASDPIADAIRRQEESIRQLTSSPMLEAIERTNKQWDAVMGSNMLEQVTRAQDWIEKSNVMALGESIRNQLTAFEEAAASSFLLSDTILSESAALGSQRFDEFVNSPSMRMAQAFAESIDTSALGQLAKDLQPLQTPLAEALAGLPKFDMPAIGAQFAALDTELFTRTSDSIAQALDGVRGFEWDNDRLLAGISRYVDVDEQVRAAWERFQETAASLDKDHPENAFEAFEAAAEEIIASAPPESRADLRRFMHDIKVGVIANIIVAGGTSMLQRLLPWLAVMFVVVAPPVLPPSPEIPPSALTAPLPRPQPPKTRQSTQEWQLQGLPEIIKRAGPLASVRTLEFFTANIRNANTRAAYASAAMRFFNWCDDRNLELDDITPFVVAAYIEELQKDASAPTVKQHLAAIRMLFDWLVVGQVLPMNPAASVRGPKHIVKRGKAPVLTPDQARTLLDSIDTSTIDGLRDRALMGLMVYSFARVGAAVRMNVEDYYASGNCWWFRFAQKGGKQHDVPAHHSADEYLDAYLEAAGIAGDVSGPLFRTLGRDRKLTDHAMTRTDVLRMIKRRALAAGLPASTCCHTFRATGITTFLSNGGTIEKAQLIAAHESIRTTKLYDRTGDELTLDEIERIVI